MKIAVILFFAVTATFAETNSAPQVQDGKKLFAKKCANCHGANGTGSFAPSLRGDLKHGNKKQQIAKVIRSGVPGTAMPSFKLPQENVTALSDYVASIRRR